MPPLIAAEEVKRDFALPAFRRSGNDGTVLLALSSEVEVPSFTELLYYLRKDLDENQKRNLQEVSEFHQISFKEELDESSTLDAMTKLLKDSGCL